jgi:hypothetical protein
MRSQPLTFQPSQRWPIRLLQGQPIERNRVYTQPFSGIAANVRASAQPGVLQNTIRLTRAAEACRL